MFKLDTELAKNMGEATYFEGELLGFYFTVKHLEDFLNNSIVKIKLDELKEGKSWVE